MTVMHNLARGENAARFPPRLGCPITSILHSEETLAGTAFSWGAASELFYLLSFPCIPAFAKESLHNCPPPPLQNPWSLALPSPCSLGLVRGMSRLRSSRLTTSRPLAGINLSPLFLPVEQD